jgi:GT2 family glycosyltransferase
VVRLGGPPPVAATPGWDKILALPDPLVSIGIVTWNSAAVIDRCVAAVRAQSLAPVELLVVDNASTDGTRERVAAITASSERVRLPVNTGFSAAHNAAIARTKAPFYLALNPDVFLDPAFLERLLAAVRDLPRVGAAAGKLLLADDTGTPRFDSTGIYLVPSQRHLDRGQGEPDTGQYERTELVFGVTGAAGFYRRAMLEDIAVGGEVFDEDFFAYREDADLAWRAQLLGWQCLYVPGAVARHVRRVTPGRRAALPPEINRMSVRNRFLLRLKNQPARQFLRFAAPALARDLQVAGYALVREWTSLPAFADLLRLLPRTLGKRRSILSRRRVPIDDVSRWFREASRPLDASSGDRWPPGRQT